MFRWAPQSPAPATAAGAGLTRFYGRGQQTRCAPEFTRATGSGEHGYTGHRGSVPLSAHRSVRRTRRIGATIASMSSSERLGLRPEPACTGGQRDAHEAKPLLCSQTLLYTCHVSCRSRPALCREHLTAGNGQSCEDRGPSGSARRSSRDESKKDTSCILGVDKETSLLGHFLRESMEGAKAGSSKHAVAFSLPSQPKGCSRWVACATTHEGRGTGVDGLRHRQSGCGLVGSPDFRGSCLVCVVSHAGSG